MTAVRLVPINEPLPVVDYRITWEAMRQTGGDFFSSITFPVRDSETHVTMIVGGWGGGLVGISSIDHMDASENPTRTEQAFENGHWYQFRIEVREDTIQAWIDDRPVVNVITSGRILGLRPGDIELTKPFGFATWHTQGRIRNLQIDPLP